MDHVTLDLAARHDAQLPRDRAGRQGMIPGDHHRRDAGGSCSSHRLDGFRSWRVRDANQPGQRGAVLGSGPGRRHGNREDAETTLGHLGVGLRRVTDAPCAQWQHALHGALDV